MKQIMLKPVAVPALAIFLLAACSNAGKKDGAKDSAATVVTHNHETTDEKETATTTVRLKDDKLNAIYGHYAHLAEALINGNVKAARLAGNAIETGAAAIQGGEGIRSSAAKITATSDIEAQRAAFSTLSNEFIALTKKSGVSSGQLYVDFCPMALNDEGGSWLSSNKAIRNPYFGDKMLTCGKLKETIE